MASPVLQALINQSHGLKIPDRQQIEHARDQMLQQGRDPAKEWEDLKRSGRMTPQQIRMVEQISKNLAHKLFG